LLSQFNDIAFVMENGKLYVELPLSYTVLLEISFQLSILFKNRLSHTHTCSGTRKI